MSLPFCSKQGKLLATLMLSGVLSACVATGGSGSSAPAADPNSPSPTSGSSTSQQANQMADRGMYKPVEYANASKPGPVIVVIPGEIKSNNASFTQKFGPNNIADYAELELGKANFKVLERSELGPMLREFQLAYTMGDPKAARKVLQKGKFKTTKWVIKFDVLKAEPVAAAQEGFDGQALGSIIGIASGSRGGAAAGVAVGSVKTSESTGVWVIGMRYKLINANTTEQVATGYTEEKMELGAKSTSVLGFSSGQAGGLTLDSLVQRLVQKNVYEIDKKHK